MRKSKDQAGLAGGGNFSYTVTVNRQMPIGNLKIRDTFVHDAFNERHQAGGPVPTKPIMWGKDFIVAEITLRKLRV